MRALLERAEGTHLAVLLNHAQIATVKNWTTTGCWAFAIDFFLNVAIAEYRDGLDEKTQEQGLNKVPRANTIGKVSSVRVSHCMDSDSGLSVHGV